MTKSTIIKESLKRSMSYQSYRDLVKQMAEENSNTGIEKTEALANYTKLNDRRMKRWDKTVKVSEEAQQRISEFSNDVTWLVITESWCGDAAHVLPALYKVADLNDHIDFKVVLRDVNPELMDAFLTNGNKAIPKVIMIDNESGEVIDTYGPRPSEATNYVKRFKAKHGALTPEFKEDLQHWYNKNKGQNVIEDITLKLCKLEPSVCQ
ncbi:thioredoxin family protein [Tamlana sp. 2201CG12-4]|uniref:thioredoxin family protein n=1 Tax=Tamlana sp. 2201CG12-4 TaxID=3112582 RepID=UPI002DBD9DED|nr:thioredoxin family protein [Tamlana sp. 2201CG12-4]MEC3906591.1 thioredoxin family protein [Tamlana sp. 2201CG12-4]